VTSIFRTARCGPACRVVWQGSREILTAPYAYCVLPFIRAVEHQGQKWVSVRIVHNWNLLLVEEALAI